MSDLALIWLSTIVTLLGTAILFVLLAHWSAGGPAPWSVAGSLARGIADWATPDGADPLPAVSPRAVELPRLEVTELAVARLLHAPTPEDEPVAEVEELA